MVDAAHKASIDACEKLLGRPLTESEKLCIHTDFKDGRLSGGISSPLKESLLERQAELLKKSQ